MIYFKSSLANNELYVHQTSKDRDMEDPNALMLHSVSLFNVGLYSLALLVEKIFHLLLAIHSFKGLLNDSD
jgi:hypothetical protein